MKTIVLQENHRFPFDFVKAGVEAILEGRGFSGNPLADYRKDTPVGEVRQIIYSFGEGTILLEGKPSPWSNAQLAYLVGSTERGAGKKIADDLNRMRRAYAKTPLFFKQPKR